MLDEVLTYQANLRISQFVQKKFGLSEDQVYNNIQKYGNTTAGSIPIALTEAWQDGKLKKVVSKGNDKKKDTPEFT